MTLNRVTFVVRPEVCDDFPELTVTPHVDGTSLVDLATAFEQQCEFDVAGGYFGLIPASFNFGELTRYYLGMQARQWPEPERFSQLG